MPKIAVIQHAPRVLDRTATIDPARAAVARRTFSAPGWLPRKPVGRLVAFSLPSRNIAAVV